jgi:hypothetical protein
MFGRDPYSYDNGHEDGLREGRSQANAQWRSKLESAEARIRGLEQLNADLAAAPRSDCERNLQRAVQDLGALERLRAHPKRAVLIALLEHDRDEWAEREAGYMVPLLDELIGLLQPGEVSRGE